MYYTRHDYIYVYIYIHYDSVNSYRYWVPADASRVHRIAAAQTLFPISVLWVALCLFGARPLAATIYAWLWFVSKKSPQVAYHYNDVIMSAMASQITSLAIVYSPFIQAQIKFPAQSASNAENVSIWWRHHVFIALYQLTLEVPRDFLNTRRPFEWLNTVKQNIRSHWYSPRNVEGDMFK